MLQDAIDLTERKQILRHMLERMMRKHKIDTIVVEWQLVFSNVYLHICTTGNIDIDKTRNESDPSPDVQAKAIAH